MDTLGRKKKSSTEHLLTVPSHLAEVHIDIPGKIVDQSRHQDVASTLVTNTKNQDLQRSAKISNKEDRSIFYSEHKNTFVSDKLGTAKGSTAPSPYQFQQQSKHHLFPEKNTTKEGCLGSLKRLTSSQTVSTFLRTTFVCVLILIPGLTLHYVKPDFIILNIKPLVFFGSIAITFFLLPFIHLVLHVLLYHVVSEKWYVNIRYGNTLFFMTEIMWYLAAVIWFLSIILLVQFVLPIFTYQEVMDQYPLQYLQPVLGVLILWISVLGVEKVCMLYLVTSFNKNTYIDRIRELLFVDYIIETMREAKRRVKYIRRMQEESAAPIKLNALWVDSPGLKHRLEHLVVPQQYVKPEEMPQEEPLSAYSWKRVLDYFYSIALQDDYILEIMGREDNDDPDKMIDVPKLESYHFLHQFNFEARHRRLNRRKSWAYHFSDQKAAHMATKIFKSLKRENENLLDIKEDLVPLFDSNANTAGIEIKIEAASPLVKLPNLTIPRQSTPQRPKSGSSQKSKETNPLISPELKEKEEKVKIGVYRFFQNKGESEKVSEKDLRQIIERSFRERRRLVESLSGMNSVVERVNDFIFILLCLFLCLSTLSIFGVDAFGALLSFSSAFLSFAFLFGQSARNVFEGLIFVLFTHPYDVGDRIVVNNNNFIVAKISLLNTVLERWDGQLIYMPNSFLSRLDIYNFRRSGPQAEQIILKVAFDTPNKLLDELNCRLNAFAEQESSDFEKRVGISLDLQFDLETAIAKVTYRHRSNWQNWELYLARRGKMYRKCIQVLKDLNIKWIPLVKPIELTHTEQPREEISPPEPL